VKEESTMSNEKTPLSPEEIARRRAAFAHGIETMLRRYLRDRNVHAVSVWIEEYGTPVHQALLARYGQSPVLLDRMKQT
jgi:hypothetical protein